MIATNYNTQQFLSYYNSLQNSSSASEANQKLMQIQRSQQSWELAKSLILHPAHTQHGCQLLSKKLGEPYTQSMDDRLKLVDFVLGLPNLNRLLWFCLAKLALHLSWEVLDLKAHTNVANLMGVLKQIPQAAAIINLHPEPHQINERARANKIFQNYKNFLIQSFEKYPQDVQECLQYFATNNFKLESEQLMRLLLTKPLSETKNILQKVLEGEKYQNLYNEIFNYLLNNESQSDTSDFFIVFLAFIRSLNLLELQAEILTSIFSKILDILKIENTLSAQQRKNVYFIGDSFDFWFQLSSKLIEARGRGQTSPQIQICKSAFAQLWKIIVQRCAEQQMPTFKAYKEQKENIIICSDSDEELGEVSEIGVPNIHVPSKFRETGDDFLHMIFSTISKSEEHKNLCLSAIFDLTNSTNPLTLELAIYVMSCIVEIAGENSMKQISAVIRSITTNQNAKNPYIWQQLVRLLGKLGHEAVCEDAIFQTALLVLKQSFLIEELAILACQNFNEILVTCSNSSEKAKQTPILQQFFDFIYGTIYFQTQNEKVFQMLTKSTIIFIYNFRPDLEYFKAYLQAMNQKIESLANLEDKLEIIDNLALSHTWVSSELSRMFTPLLSQFFAAFLPVAITYVAKCPTKKLSPVFSQLSTIVSTGGGYNTQIWVQAFIELSQLENVMKQKHLIINLFIKLMQVQQYDHNHYKPAVINLIKNVEPFVISSLEDSTQNEFKLVNKCLSFHFIFLSKYVGDVANYNPDRVLGFIVGRIFKGEMKFQFQSCRTSLAIIRNVMERGYRVQELLEQVLKVYPKIVDLAWKSIQAILYEAYKQGGNQLYRAAFKNVYPVILPPNPLFDMLMQAISQSNSKSFKNLLASLK